MRVSKLKTASTIAHIATSIKDRDIDPVMCRPKIIADTRMIASMIETADIVRIVGSIERPEAIVRTCAMGDSTIPMGAIMIKPEAIAA